MGRADSSSLKCAIARTKAAMEEDKLIAELGDLLGVALRRRLCGFVGLPGYRIEIVNGGGGRLAAAWRRALERAEPIETPVVLFRSPGREYRALMSVAHFTDCPASENLQYTVEMSLTAFALFCQQAQVRQMTARMEDKQLVMQRRVQ